MDIQQAKKKLAMFRRTPLHPQWLIFRHEKQKMAQICQQLDGTVVDIGCAAKTPKQFLPNNCNYIGLDYPVTANNWYLTKPDVFGDAQCLPFKKGSINNALLLDVLEHIPNPEKCIAEIYAVLKPNGKLIIRVPFMYPIHDAPLDFHRWTIHGLHQMATKNGFQVINSIQTGNPVETAAMLTNIALTKTALIWIEKKNPLTLLIPPLIPLINIFGWFFSFLGAKTSIMPYSYTMTWQKKQNAV